MEEALNVVSFAGSVEGFSGSSGAKRDKFFAGNASSPGSWNKVASSELYRETCQLQRDNAPSDHGLGNQNSHSLMLDAEPILESRSSSKVVRSSSGCSKRSGVVQREVFKCKPGLHDVDGVSIDLSSSPASCNISERSQVVKLKNVPNCRRGDKRSSKVHKTRCDSFSLKNGLVGINSAVGGNNFFGIYGLKPDVIDITKYVNELSLDELIRGSYNRADISKDKGKQAGNSNNNILLSVKKACSVLQAQKVLSAGKCADADNGSICETSMDLVNASLEAGEDDCFAAVLPPSDKVQENGYKIKSCISVSDSPLYQPKDILERLKLPPPKDLDSLLSDASKPTSSSKNSTDPRVGKVTLQRTGLPPFPWSHSFSGHSKLGADAGKLSTSRTTCHGRWVKVKNSAVPQKAYADLLVDFESLTFDESLVPKLTIIPERPGSGTTPTERVLFLSEACLPKNDPADESSPTFAAARTLCDMATHPSSSKEKPSALVKFLKKPSQISTKPSKLNSISKSDRPFDTIKYTTKPQNPVKFGDTGFPSKKLRLSTDVTNVHFTHTDSVRTGPLHRSAPQSFISPPRKLIRDSIGGTDSFSVNVVKSSYVMKPPRNGERPSGTRQELRKVVPMKWSRANS